MGGVTHNTSLTRAPQAGRDVPGSPALAPQHQGEAPQSAKTRTDALLRDLWRRKQPMVREHLGLLQRTLDVLTNATLTAPLRSEAAISAHKLAGSLGMFGFHDGTRLARELEQLLDAPEMPPARTFASLLGQLTASLPL